MKTSPAQITSERQPAPRRSRRPAEETREDILNMAETLFRAHGYASVTIADIAAELAMSPANVFKHFRTKASLVDAIATRAIQETIGELKILDQNKPAPVRLYELARHLMDEHLSDQKDAPFVFEMIQVTIREELDCGERFREMVVETIAEIIRAGEREGLYKVTDIPRYANVAFDALACVIHPVMLGMENKDKLATRCKEVVNLVDIALRSPLAK
ncbi:TetR family transcriptional regulator [Rhizobium sp. CECT 9324]|jgi:TetR/AcrR family transcriptional repressor of the ameABC operon|uniref:TetR family transcriptional regulator n=1 Tax=Rhizobium sp. CECT 9324 TaxID=2845820 RepID=UPI000DDD3917|nr:TetR family transcriptional regulator [Rhizobium sp. CECT 9324]